MSNETHESDVAFIRALAELLNENDLTELSVKREYGEDDTLNVRVSRRGETVTTQPSAAPWLSPKLVTVNSLPNVLPDIAYSLYWNRGRLARSQALLTTPLNARHRKASAVPSRPRRRALRQRHRSTASAMPSAAAAAAAVGP